MRRRVLLCLTLVSLSACNGDRIGQPIDSPPSPSTDISDASHPSAVMSSNPDFFFLPPMVKNPNGSTEWNAGAFNDGLRPRVEICASSNATTAVFPMPCAPIATLVATVDRTAELYQANWKVPEDATVFYRIVVRVGDAVLGFADVQTGATTSALKNVATNEYIPLVDGRTLPIKFRIERYALCSVPGAPTCGTQTIDLAVGGTVETSLTPTGLPSGIVFAPAPGTPSSEHTVTVQGCGDFHVREVTDLPTFGPCLRVLISPALTTPLPAPALVFSCDVSEQAVTAGVIDANQAERIALHRLLANGKVEALAHDHPDCGAGPIASSGSLRGMLASLARGQVKAAASQALSLLAPRPLYAARFIDLGGGGRTFLADDVLSEPSASRAPTRGARLSLATAAAVSITINEFQFALPAKFELPAVQIPWTQAPVPVAVSVTDVGGQPVRNARVRFRAAHGTVVPGVVDSIGATGVATALWTMAPPDSDDSLYVSGKGIGGADFSGPRKGIDPFQPLQTHWGDATSSATPVAVRTGSVWVTPVVGGNTGPVLYGVNSGDDGLSTIDPVTGVSTFVGRLSPDPNRFTTPVSMATDPRTGVIYVWNNSGIDAATGRSFDGVLLTVDRCTGLATPVSATPQSQVTGSGAALAVSPTTGDMYVLTQSLSIVDKATGVATFIGSLGGNVSVFGADFDARGVLYALGAGGQKLYTIDLASGAATEVATLGVAVGTIGSIAFTGTGTLLGSSLNGTLFDIDPATGAVTNVRTITGTGGTPQGMDFSAACTTP